MASFEVLLPAMGEGIREATITRWLKKAGDPVREDEALAEVATDKVDTEIPSPADGYVARLLFKEGESPFVGSVMAIISSTRDEEIQNAEAEKQPPAEAPSSFKTFAKVTGGEKKTDISNIPEHLSPSGRFLSPLVRSIAEKEGLSPAELDKITGTGKDGRITRTDLMNFLKYQETEHIPVSEPDEPEKPAMEEKETKDEIRPETKEGSGPGIEIIEMDRIRKLIAVNMVRSKQVSAHVTSFVEIDVTDLVNWRDQVKDEFFKHENEKLTFTPIFVEAVVKALRDFPMINVSVEGTNILVKKFINIGIATALPSGNLIVPVIKNADQKNLTGLAKSVNDLADRARKNKLLPDEITGGTFTITNFGTFANLTGTPIINQPESAILGTGVISKKPAVVSTPKGDFIAVRQIMILSLAYDHRVIDGALGGQFLRRTGDYLESWDTARKI